MLNILNLDYFISIIFLIKHAELLEINAGNCVNNDLLETRCVFNISIKYPLSKKHQCRFQFTKPNDGQISVINKNVTISASKQHKCPEFALKLYSPIVTKLGSTCGGTLGYMKRSLNNFTYGILEYDNFGLFDSSSIIEISISLVNQKSCDETVNSKWFIIIIIICNILLAIIFLVAIVVARRLYRRCKENAEKTTKMNDTKNDTTTESTNKNKTNIDLPEINENTNMLDHGENVKKSRIPEQGVKNGNNSNSNLTVNTINIGLDEPDQGSTMLGHGGNVERKILKKGVGNEGKSGDDSNVTITKHGNNTPECETWNDC